MSEKQYYVSVCPDTGRQFLVETGKDNNIVELTTANVETIRNSFSLLAHIAEQVTEYKENIVPLQTDDADDSFETYDSEENELLESLWDVILEHFNNGG